MDTLAAGCRMGGGRLQGDQFDVDAELDAACALVQLQQFLARLKWQFRLAIAFCGLAVLLGIANRTGEFRFAVIEQWLRQWLQWRYSAGAGMADASLARQRG